MKYFIFLLLAAASLNYVSPAIAAHHEEGMEEGMVDHEDAKEMAEGAADAAESIAHIKESTETLSHLLKSETLDAESLELIQELSYDLDDAIDAAEEAGKSLEGLSSAVDSLMSAAEDGNADAVRSAFKHIQDEANKL